MGERKLTSMAEGHSDLRPGEEGYQRVRELADEINRQGPAGKLRALVRQVMRAAGAQDQETAAGRLSELLAIQIKGSWTR